MNDEKAYDGKYIRLEVNDPDALRTKTSYIVNTTGTFVTADDPSDVEWVLRQLIKESIGALDALNAATDGNPSIVEGIAWALGFTIDSIDRGDHDDYPEDHDEAVNFVNALRGLLA